MRKEFVKNSENIIEKLDENKPINFSSKRYEDI